MKLKMKMIEEFNVIFIFNYYHQEMNIFAEIKAMTAELGILAFGSLIDRPGREIEEAIIVRHSALSLRAQARREVGLQPLFRSNSVAARSWPTFSS